MFNLSETSHVVLPIKASLSDAVGQRAIAFSSLVTVSDTEAVHLYFDHIGANNKRTEREYRRER